MRDFIGRGGTLGVVAMGAVLASLAMAPAAGAATYHGCVSKKSDVLRLVSISKKCKKGEERISFNSQGPPGRNGSNGQNGANGANGTNGTDGTTGFTSTLPSGKTEARDVVWRPRRSSHNRGLLLVDQLRHSSGSATGIFDHRPWRVIDT